MRRLLKPARPRRLTTASSKPDGSGTAAGAGPVGGGGPAGHISLTILIPGHRPTDCAAAPSARDAGLPWPKSLADARERLQANVNKWHDRFKGDINIKRSVPDASMTGQVYEGMEAIEAGLADGVVDDLNDVIALMTNL